MIGADTFLWRVYHRHVSREEERINNPCAEVFTAFLENHTKTPVRILFPETSQHGPGYPSQAGVILDYQHPKQPINLNFPSIARFTIQLALNEGWSPSTSTTELQIDNGYGLFRAHRVQLESILAAIANA